MSRTSSEDSCCSICFEHMNVPEFLKLSKFGSGANKEASTISLKENSTEQKKCSKGTVTKIYRRSSKGMCGPLPWSILPIFAGLVPLIGLAITYAIAKTSCHVEKWIFPYVSYTGTRFPELMYFGLLLNLEGFFGVVIVFLAWRYYRHLGERGGLNNFTLVVGSISCLGVVIVGNFPVTYSKVPHYFGAALAFILGTFYTVLTAVLSKRTAGRSNLNKIHRVKICRIVLAIVMCLGLVSLMAFAAYKSTHPKSSTEAVNEEELLKPKPNGSCPFYPNETRNIDLFGSLVEWILTIGILICLGMYSYEFKAFNAVKIVLKQKNGEMLERCPYDCDDEDDDDVTIGKQDLSLDETTTGGGDEMVINISCKPTSNHQVCDKCQHNHVSADQRSVKCDKECQQEDMERMVNKYEKEQNS